uniref:Zinc finger ccch domain-containing protein 40 n=1 Tax=Tetraselmis sp. GSL018 TaxID=582737 RepID=A0A061SMF8_9CHLO
MGLPSPVRAPSPPPLAARPPSRARRSPQGASKPKSISTGVCGGFARVGALPQPLGRSPALARCLPHSVSRSPARHLLTNRPILPERAGDMPTLTPPEDKSIMTLYVGGLNNSITEKDLEDVFYAHGEIKSIKKIESRSCAFVTYTSRLSAEAAAESLANRLIIKGTRLKLMWGKPQPPPQPRPDPMQPSTSGAPAPPIAMVPPQMQMQMGAARPFMPAPNFFNLPTPESGGAPMYPSMDPTAMGTRVPALGEPPKDPYEGSEDEPSKRQRMDALPAGGMGPMSGHGMHPPPPMMMSRPPMPPPPMPPPAHQ